MNKTVDHISSSLRIPLEPGIPEGASPLSITHFNWPSEYDCTSGELSNGTGGDMLVANGTPVF